MIFDYAVPSNVDQMLAELDDSCIECVERSLSSYPVDDDGWRQREQEFGEENLRNVRMVAGNAEPLFESRIPPASLEAVHVYFPDPWWKKRHRKRRVVNERSVRNFLRSLRSGGRFHFWTDVLDYFESTVEMIAEIAPEFGVPIPEEEIESTHDLDFRTHFERRSRQNQIPVYRVRYEKRAVDAKRIME